MKRNLKICRLPEVVFAPSEKEAVEHNSCNHGNAFGNAEHHSVSCDGQNGVLIFGGCWTGLGEIAFLGLSFYVKPMDKIWKGKVITYMDE